MQFSKVSSVNGSTVTLDLFLRLATWSPLGSLVNIFEVNCLYGFPGADCVKTSIC